MSTADIWLPQGTIEGAKQSNPTAWHEQRRGLVTASRFADVMSEPRSPERAFVDAWKHLIPEEERYKVLKTGPRAGQRVEVENLGRLVMEAAEHQGAYCWGDTARGYMMELMASALTGEDRVGGKSAAMERGNDKESDAIDRYEADNFLTVHRARLLLLDGTRIGATKDGFVEDHEDGPGLIEVKCPESKTHMLTWLRRTLPDEYLYQVQGQLWISGRQWCDFISFDDRFPRAMSMVVVRVNRDEELIARMSRRVKAFADELTGKLGEIRAYLATCAPEEREVVKKAMEDAITVVDDLPWEPGGDNLQN